MEFLTKSDFKVGRTCPTKLYYKKLGYPSLTEESPYVEFLADGGYMVETMAKLLFPGGLEMGAWGQPDCAWEAVRTALADGRSVLFEATILHEGLLARVDILRRSGDRLEIIEVKSTSIDGIVPGQSPFRGKRAGIEAKWRPYLEDVAFQTLVVRRAFPGFVVVPSLCVVNKSVPATPDATVGMFRLIPLADQAGGLRPAVEYLGNVEALRRRPVVAIVDVSAEVEELLPEVEATSGMLAESLRSDPISRLVPTIGLHCKSCEFRVLPADGGKNGFRECWGALADAEPHVLDLYRVDLLGGKGGDIVAGMAKRGEARVTEVRAEWLTGAVAERQSIQVGHSASGTEYVSPELGTILASHPSPLHFIDFEGSRLAIPYHAGMRPYEQAAFQWSCHTLGERNDLPQHAEWLNDVDGFPNFEFARRLMQKIGRNGTVYIWSLYELTVLKEIRQQMEQYGERDDSLRAWLDEVTEEGNPRIVDLCAMAKAHFFHPAMKGSLSIKYVLPAVWGADEAVRSHPAFAKYVRKDKAGGWLNPYDVLPPLPIGRTEEVVKEGTGAMRVYQEMMFGVARGNPATRNAYRRLLLQYCELDTAAMVIIWLHWGNRLASRKSR